MVVTKLSDPKPEIDNLYLDMNGIVHVCCRSEGDAQPLENMSEEYMIRSIYAYLEHIFSSIMPKKRFFMAIDGVAPRAKLNQQRQRRFRKVITQDGSGSAIPSGFDSNCITPGTSFMLTLSKCIDYFIKYKISTHAAWRSCEIIYSSHRDPGEGEHKILSYIRSLSYDQEFCSESHCLYGLDADLIMLSLSTHIPNFVLLREIVQFGNHWKKEQDAEKMKKKSISLDKSLETPSEFVIFHVKALREYIGMEMQAEVLERIIDDFIFLCFFLGNDFLPGLPGMSISEGAIAAMLAIYKKCCLAANKYMIRDETPDWGVIMEFLSALAKEQWNFISKKINSFKPKSEIERGKLSQSKSLDQYRQIYYETKLMFTDSSQVRSLSRAYIEGLMWVFEYYYKSCPDWGWYFPFHYSPLVSDLIFPVESVPRPSFSKGRPFTPYEQLLAVLPRESYQCVPKSVQSLMIDENSPLRQEGFYPNLGDIPIDYEGCRNEWEGVMLLPFMDEKFLQECYQGILPSLSEEENQNNQPEPTVVYKFDASLKPVSTGPSPFPSFPTVENCFVKEVSVSYNDRPICRNRPPESFPFGIGSFQSIKQGIATSFTTKETKVFGQASRNPSMIVDLSRRCIDSSELNQRIGSIVSIGYPFLKRAILLGVAAEDSVCSGKFNQDLKLEKLEYVSLGENEKMTFKEKVKNINDRLLAACGLKLAPKCALLRVKHVLGVRPSNNGELILQYDDNETVYPPGLMVDTLECIETVRKDLADPLSYAPIHQEVILLPGKGSNNGQIHGLCGRIEAIHQKSGLSKMLSVSVVQSSFTNDKSFYHALSERVQMHSLLEQWKSSMEVCHLVKMPHRVLMNICDSVLCANEGKTIQLGLQLIDRQFKLSRAGWAKLVNQSQSVKNVTDNTFSDAFAVNSLPEDASRKGFGPTWYFSKEAVQLIRQYMKRFSAVIEALPTDVRYPQQVDIEMLQDTKGKDRVDREISEMVVFLNARTQDGSCSKAVEMLPAEEDMLPHDTLVEVEKLLLEFPVKNANQLEGKVVENIPLTSVVFPCVVGSCHTGILPSVKCENPKRILQRVVYFGSTGAVPFGARGCIVRVLPDGKHVEVLLDHAYLECTRLKGRLQTHRGAILSRSLLIVTSSFEDFSRSSSKVNAGKTVERKVLPNVDKKISKPEQMELNICASLKKQLALQEVFQYDEVVVPTPSNSQEVDQLHTTETPSRKSREKVNLPKTDKKASKAKHAEVNICATIKKQLSIQGFFQHDEVVVPKPSSSQEVDSVHTTEKPSQKSKEKRSLSNVDKKVHKSKPKEINICASVPEQLSLQGATSSEETAMAKKLNSQKAEATHSTEMSPRVSRQKIQSASVGSPSKKCIFGESCIIVDESHVQLYHPVEHRSAIKVSSHAAA